MLFGSFLQRIVFCVVTLKILCCFSPGYTLERIISELTAAVRGWYQPIMAADHRFLVDLSRKLTVCTVAVNFFSEQHCGTAFQKLPPLYTMMRLFSIAHFSANQTNNAT